jgi:hypothetical protein
MAGGGQGGGQGGGFGSGDGGYGSNVPPANAGMFSNNAPTPFGGTMGGPGGLGTANMGYGGGMGGFGGFSKVNPYGGGMGGFGGMGGPAPINTFGTPGAGERYVDKYGNPLTKNVAPQKPMSQQEMMTNGPMPGLIDPGFAMPPPPGFVPQPLPPQKVPITQFPSELQPQLPPGGVDRPAPFGLAAPTVEMNPIFGVAPGGMDQPAPGVYASAVTSPGFDNYSGPPRVSYEEFMRSNGQDPYSKEFSPQKQALQQQFQAMYGNSDPVRPSQKYPPFLGGFGGYGRFGGMPNMYNPFAQFSRPSAPIPSRLINAVAGGPSPMVGYAGGGIASLRYADGGKVGYEDLGAKLPSTQGTSAQDTYNRVMALGSSPEYAAYYNSLPSHLRAYAASPNDPNWAYQAAQERNQFEVNQGMDAFSPQSPNQTSLMKGARAGSSGSPLARYSRGLPAGQFGGSLSQLFKNYRTGSTAPDAPTSSAKAASASGTKPLIIGPQSVPKDDSGDDIVVDAPPPDSKDPTPSPLGVSEKYTPYTKPARRGYIPDLYGLNPNRTGQIGRNPTPNDPERFIFVPTPIPRPREIPTGPKSISQGNQGITGLMK